MLARLDGKTYMSKAHQHRSGCWPKIYGILVLAGSTLSWTTTMIVTLYLFALYRAFGFAFLQGALETQAQAAGRKTYEMSMAYSESRRLLRASYQSRSDSEAVQLL